MKSVLKGLLSALLCVSVLTGVAGCAGDSFDSSAGESETITIVDHSGAEVKVKKNIERIAVANILPLPSVLSVFFDSADKIVGIAPQSMTAAQNSLLGELYPELLKADTGFFDGTNINVEELIALNPDVVFYNSDTPAVREAIESAGIPAVAISARKWENDACETLNRWIDLLDQMFTGNDKAKLCRERSDASKKLITDRLLTVNTEQKPKILYLYQYSETDVAVPGISSFGNWWASFLGGENVSSELEGTNGVEVNMEQIYKWNPDVIFITNFNSAYPDDLYNNTFGSFDWSGVSAIQNKRVYKMPLGMYRSYTPGIDTPITLLWSAKCIYPELFSDIDITAQTISYYKDVFGIELSEEQANRIFSPDSDAAAW